MQPSDTPALLSLLGRHHVEFIVVGVTAAVLQGAPVVTFDLDIVYRRSPENVVRLLEALDEIEACFRNTPGRRIAPNTSHLESTGHKLLLTKLGPLDVLGSLDEATGYEELLPHTVVLRVGEHEVRALGLERLIEEKQRAGRPKDLAALPVLRATLARARRS
ncbi:MAG: hypothetical protein JNL79_19920 [Myxococcales bacterium]|nr:hypothetical protein [Myxococcales bacterium]